MGIFYGFCLYLILYISNINALNDNDNDPKLENTVESLDIDINIPVPDIPDIPDIPKPDIPPLPKPDGSKPVVPSVPQPNVPEIKFPDMSNVPNFNNTKPDFGDKSNDMTKLLEKNREMVKIMNGLRFGGGYGKYKISDFSQKKMLEFTNKLTEYAEKTQDLLEQWHNGVLTDEQLNEKSDKLLKEMTKYINNFLGRAVSVSPISWLWIILIAVL